MVEICDLVSLGPGFESCSGLELRWGSDFLWELVGPIQEVLMGYEVYPALQLTKLKVERERERERSDNRLHRFSSTAVFSLFSRPTPQ